MKKTISFILALMLCISCVIPAVAANPVQVTINGKAVQWSDAEPFIDKNSRTMIPLRAVADAMGLDVNWDAAAREAAFTNGTNSICFPIGNNVARTDDGKSVQMDTAAIIVDSRTYAPIRYLAEFFGYTVGWDAATRTVIITSGDSAGNEIPANPSVEIPNEVPTAKTSYKDLIPGNPQLITWHDANDMEAVDNNIRYMLKNGLNKIQLKPNGSMDNTVFRSAFTESYVKGMMHYIEFGFHETNLYYTSGFYKETEYNNVTISLSSPFFSDEELAKYQADALAEAIKVHDQMWSSGAITASMTEREKAKVYYDWIVKNCDYDFGFNRISYYSYGAFINGKAVCQGYTSAYNLLLKLEGIDCSTEEIPGYHIWTTANLDGVFCHIDATWGDQNNLPAEKYFAMTPEESWARFK